MSTKSLAIGDRVHWTPVGWDGTVVDMSTPGHVKVEWDGGVGRYFNHPPVNKLEKINMSDKLVKGDRVRYIGTTTDYIGKSGYLVGGPIGTDAVVRWDGSESNSHVLPTNLARVDKIDTTKALEVSSGTNTSDMTFITMTSEGYILVSPVSKSGLGSGSTWMMFDTDGKFVRSETGNGFALVLRNKVSQPIIQNGNVVIPGFGTTLLQLTSIDGQLTAVKLA